MRKLFSLLILTILLTSSCTRSVDCEVKPGVNIEQTTPKDNETSVLDTIEVNPKGEVSCSF